MVANLSKELGVDAVKVSGPDREAAQQLAEENFESYLSQEEQFHDLVQDVLDSVRARFDLIEAGELLRRKSGWPELWLLKSDDRDEFLRHIRWFSGNTWTQFGRLLTPLVEGIRVRGPLFPEFADIKSKLVLIDGQGLALVAVVALMSLIGGRIIPSLARYRSVFASVRKPSTPLPIAAITGRLGLKSMLF